MNLIISGKYEELLRDQGESTRMVKEQAELIKQLEGDLLNMRRIPSSVYRGEGVGAPSTPTDSELMIKAVQDIETGEGIYHYNNFFF